MSSQAVTANTEEAILARVIESGPSSITPDVARYLLSMQLPVADEERVNELSAKARADSLSGTASGRTGQLPPYWPASSELPCRNLNSYRIGVPNQRVVTRIGDQRLFDVTRQIGIREVIMQRRYIVLRHQ